MIIQMERSCTRKSTQPSVLFQGQRGVSQNQPIRLPGLSFGFARDGSRDGALAEPKPGVCLSTSSRPRAQPRGSGLILSGAFYPDLKVGVWRRRMYQDNTSPWGAFLLVRKDRRFKEHLDMPLKAGRRIDPISVGQGDDGLPVPSTSEMEKDLKGPSVR